jgi:broad specificity phosphatase PhoE
MFGRKIEIFNMDNVYLIRHAQSEGNANPSVYFEKDDDKIALTQKGIEQANATGELVANEFRYINNPIYFIYSPYLRTQQTHDIIKTQCESQGIKCNSVEDPLIRERHWGSLRDRKDSFKDGDFDFFKQHDKGESFAQCQDRANIFYLKLRGSIDRYKMYRGKYEDYNEPTIIVISHGEFIKCLMNVHNNWGVEKFSKLKNPRNAEFMHITHELLERGYKKENKDSIMKTCENCKMRVNIQDNSGHSPSCGYIYGRRGWRQLGV